jgi:hypothetical protein
MLFLLTALYNWHAVLTRCTTAKTVHPNNKQQNIESLYTIFMIEQPSAHPESAQLFHRYPE